MIIASAGSHLWTRKFWSSTFLNYNHSYYLIQKVLTNSVFKLRISVQSTLGSPKKGRFVNLQLPEARGRGLHVDAVIDDVEIQSQNFNKEQEYLNTFFDGTFNRISIQFKLEMAWSLVCPASRGIGFHLTRCLLETTSLPVVATARHDTEGVKKNILQDLKDVDSKRLTVLEVDVTGKKKIYSFIQS